MAPRPPLPIQPVGSVFQVAYTCADARETALAWTASLGIGPWTVRGPFTAPGALYRGEPYRAELTVARTFDGALMIELIQQHDEEPSIFRDRTTAEGYGFHHVAVATNDFDTRARSLSEASGQAVFEDVLPTGARVAFFDGAPGQPGMVELVELTSAQSASYDSLRELCRTWDGTDPWRRL
ncbi:VOC family protein [Salinibacterium hongtaonis]|uniref:VOC family protein n=1 Tax=Homoserinimonas hongtaonis TaxID=2079791 RepID=UPI001304A774|nr:VOC family protein [Salinibacterium hongtaonis]